MASPASSSPGVFTKRATSLPGAFVLTPRPHRDTRGSFAKLFHSAAFAQLGLDFTVREQFYSISAKNVLRGMHFQAPPQHHAKLVACLQGRILDVLLDLRRGAPTFGQHFAVELVADRPAFVFIPPGLAHGFLALTDEALTLYNTSTPHAPEHDRGVHWASFGFDWPVTQPIISARDASLPGLAELSSPF